MARELRSRFYDGGFYALLLDPLVSGLHRVVAKELEPGSRVLDVGCGTGNLAELLAKEAEEVVGVELSPAMAAYATKRSSAYENVSIVTGDITEVLSEKPDGYFDAATMVLALHEMPVETRGPVLREVTRLAKRLVCLEYRVPMPWSLGGVRNRLAELLAGPEHFRAFQDFCRRGGTEGVAAAAGLEYRNVYYPGKGSFDLARIRPRPG